MRTRELMMYIDGRLNELDFNPPKPNIPEGKLFLRIQENMPTEIQLKKEE